jgi:hypothetical protein
MAKLDDQKYRLLVDSLVSNYISQFGAPPKKEKELDAYTDGIFSHYINTSDNFMKFFNKIPVNLSNIQIVDRTGRSLFIDIRGNKGHSADAPKRTVKYDGTIGPRNISETNRYAFYLLLKNDFKESAKRIGYSMAMTPPAKEQNIKTPEKPSPPTGSLEKDFKALAVEGRAADVLAAFKTVTKNLPEKDKADLSASLKSSGIYTSNDLQGLLNRWKNEALTENPERKQNRSQARSLSQGPSISMN